MSYYADAGKQVEVWYCDKESTVNKIDFSFFFNRERNDYAFVL